jgi:hypothetical protein
MGSNERAEEFKFSEAFEEVMCTKCLEPRYLH